MPIGTKVVVSCSSGKDSALALHEARRSGEVEVVGILTTITSEFGRVSMHGVRESLLDQQAEALGLPCWKVPIPSPCPNEVYEREMARVLAAVRELGVTAVVFGDLFLEDLRRWRAIQLARVRPEDRDVQGVPWRAKRAAQILVGYARDGEALPRRDGSNG